MRLSETNNNKKSYKCHQCLHTRVCEQGTLSMAVWCIYIYWLRSCHPARTNSDTHRPHEHISHGPWGIYTNMICSQAVICAHILYHALLTLSSVLVLAKLYMHGISGWEDLSSIMTLKQWGWNIPADTGRWSPAAITRASSHTSETPNFINY